MNYIVIDLEWNQSPVGKEGEVKNLPFEIIEIGAVKLDPDRRVMDRFHEVIKPQIYLHIHPHTREIIHVDLDAMKQSDPFPVVARRFFDWCGSDYLFGTWGPSDLTELQRNLDYYGLTGYIKTPVFYYDIQKLFSLEFEGRKNTRALEYAVDYLKLDKKEAFHNALFDAEYTASVLKRLNPGLVKEYFSVDYYHNPKCREEEISILYKTYMKHISREFKTKEAAVNDREVLSALCYQCGRPSEKRISWFPINSKTYLCLAYCRKHGYLKGKISLKKTAGGNYLAVKILKLISEEEAEGLKACRKETYLKKKLKNKRNSL